MNTALVGNLTDDPELKFSKAGNPWSSFKLAVTPYVPGEHPEPVYYSVVCFGSLAENVCESTRKGSRVVVAGRLEDETWTGRDGVERTSQKIVADGIGPDLRFTTATITRTTRRQPTEPDTTITGLIGATPARGYSEEPF
jgi:single-strand DNA-binding protein